MNEIIELTRINFSYVFVAVFTILIGIKAIASLFEWVGGTLGLETKWMRKRREEHDLLIRTSQNLTALQAKHKEDVKQSDEHDERIHKELTSFMSEMRNSMLENQKEIRRFEEHGKQIEALMCGNKELLGAEIDKRYREYVALDGIPESEVDEFHDIFAAYKGLKGNHGRDTKYHYVRNHLPVIPVETKLIMNKEENSAHKAPDDYCSR